MNSKRKLDRTSLPVQSRRNSGDENTKKFRLALDAAYKDNKFEVKEFIKKWFRSDGSAYYFLFRKHLGVTNIQMAELFALIRSHLRFAGTERPYLRFLSIPEFADSMKLLFETFSRVKSPVDTIAKLYTDLYLRTVVIDPFYGSCAVYVPPSLGLDLEKICGESGYIHSCGMAVFIERVYKTKAAAFSSVVKRYLQSVGTDKKILFAVYAREDWPDKNEKMPELVAKGLEEVKVPVGKFFMGQRSIQAVLTDLGKQNPDRLAIARPGHLHEDRELLEKEGNVCRDRTLFLVVDRQIGENPRHPGDTRFFICYEQQLLNCNPCHVFDEDKPAWIDHTTIPHTLMGAMINITQPWWSSRVTLCDPFVGSGTAWLEALKYSQVNPVCSDLHPMAEHLAYANLAFFAKTREELETLRNRIVQLVGGGPSLKRTDPFQKAKRLYQAYKKAARSNGELPFSASLIRRFEKEPDELFRYAFFLILKVERRSAGLELDDEQWTGVFLREVNHLATAIDFVLGQEKRVAYYETSDARIVVGQGAYSRASAVNFRYIQSVSEKGTCKGERSVTALPRDSVDVIVTDPPYGFNTNDDPTELAQLYAKMIPCLVNSLRDEGQLVLALPDWSHTGREILAFTYKEFVTHQVLLAADNRGWEVIRSASPATRERDLFRAPFYWESDRALRRAILHFRFRNKAVLRGRQSKLTTKDKTL